MSVPSLPTLTPQQINHVFSRIDTDGNGVISSSEIKRGLEQLNIPANEHEVEHLVHLIKSSRKPTTTSNDTISIAEFSSFLQAREAQLHAVFHSLDTDHNGRLDTNEITAALGRLGVDSTPQMVQHMIDRIDKNSDGRVDYSEFRAMALLLPSAEIQSIVDMWQSTVEFIDLGETSYTTPVIIPKSAMNWKVLIAGGVAGAVSRTATAPMDRLKVLLQAGAGGAKEPSGIISGLRGIYAEGGWTAFFRGNGTNVLKIMPESAVKFYAFEYIRNTIARDPNHTTAVERFSAGALAGVISQTCIYPLEVCKTRLSVVPTGTYKCVQRIIRTNVIHLLM
jgi:solute carrier family 25 (mitochondrial phosphate transporter), member 23/24/25/41